MDRNIVYPGAIPLDTDALTPQRSAMIALGFLAQAALGSSTVVDGLACIPTSPASLSVLVGPGSILQLGVVDASAFGSDALDNSDALVKMGINIGSTTLTMAAPTVSGQSVNYLIEAAFSETDGTPVVLPYFNAANVNQPYSGPSNSGAAQNTQRTQRVMLQLKAGTPAATGTQATPSADGGFVGLYSVTLAYGQTSITSGSIAQLPAAPFINFKVPQLTPGFSRRVVLNAAGSGTWTVPNGVTLLRATVIGGGGGGGGSTGAYAGGGGGAGGFASGTLSVTPGAAISYTVGAGGAGGSAGASAPNGAASTFGGALSGGGGLGGQFVNASDTFGGAGGTGSGGELYGNGGSGDDGQNGSTFFGGCGGSSMLGGGGRASTATGGVVNPAANGQAPGSGGGGVYLTAGTGGNGAAGVVIIEY
jgi:hypothetical protein